MWQLFFCLKNFYRVAGVGSKNCCFFVISFLFGFSPLFMYSPHCFIFSWWWQRRSSSRRRRGRDKVSAKLSTLYYHLSVVISAYNYFMLPFLKILIYKKKLFRRIKLLSAKIFDKTTDNILDIFIRRFFRRIKYHGVMKVKKKKQFLQLKK